MNYHTLRDCKILISIHTLSAWLVVFLNCLLLASGCSLIHVSDIPDLYTDDVIYEKMIREIKIEGLRHTRDYVVKRSMASKVGQVYTKQSASLDFQRLSQLGIFTTIQFDVNEKDNEITLLVKLTEVNPYVPSPSFKITDQNGLEIGVALSSPNLFGSASSLSAWLRGGGATNIGVRFKYPWYPGASWWSASQGDYFHVERYNKIYHFNESSDEFNLIFQPNISHNLRLGPRVSYLSLKSDNPGITLDSDNRDDIPGIGLTMLLDTRNLLTYATDGWWSEINMSYFFGNASYWQGDLDVRKYFQLGSVNNSIALYSLTTLTSGKIDIDIPEYMQFNIGGTNTVRGWGLGSREGKNQFINTAEYRHILIKPKVYQFWFIKQIFALQGALFMDVGTAWSRMDQFHRNWIAGGGAGLRLLTAKGMSLRLDVSFGQPGLSLDLNIGFGEKPLVQRDRIR